MIDSDYERILSDKSYFESYHQLFIGYSDSIKNRIECLTENKNKYFDQEQILYQKIDNHFDQIQIKVDEAKKRLKTQLSKDLKNFEENLSMITCQADEIKSKLDNEIKAFVQTVDSTNETSMSENFDDYDDMAVTINESVNEFDEDLKSPDKQKQKLLKIFESIETLMGEERMIDEVVDEHSQMRKSLDLIKFEDCMPNFDEECFGHFEKTPLTCKMNKNITLDQLSHTKFKLEDPISLERSMSFQVDQKCSITFSCPNILGKTTSGGPLHSLLEFNIYDSLKCPVNKDLKEKITDKKHFIRVYFIPTKPGVHKICFKFNNVNITNGPFSFTVLPKGKEIDTNNILQVIKPEPTISKTYQPDVAKIQEIVKTPPKMPSINAGRGKLLKQRPENKTPKRGVTTGAVSPFCSTGISSFGSFISQKRKSPSFDNERDFNNNLPVNDDMKELSSKLKKVSVDETENTLHEYSNNVDMSFLHEKNQRSWISDHLRKHSPGILNSLLPSLLNSPMPNMKAKFVCQYNNLNFPIGVRVCKRRNWVITCDSGNNSVKIFDRETTKLIQNIDGNYDKTNTTKGFTMKRPSAVLIDEQTSEMFVKDDKEILVFDTTNNCKFLRKFGSGILKRPYGLAFNTQGNVVLVDADLKDPRIHIFDKKSGVPLYTSSYQPVMPAFAQSQILNGDFPDPPLGTNLQPFAKTKVRFLCMNQDDLYASDLGRSIVFKTNLQGDIKLAFGTNGTKKGQMNEPSGIQVDHDGQAILVGDSKNDRIQVYDPKGIYKCDVEIIDHRLVRPSDLYLDTDGYLYVANFTQHNIKKFKLLED